MEEIFNPYDKLFRETWSDLATAKSFLHNYLPEEVLTLTSLDTLEICKDSFIEKDLRGFYFDLLYKVDLAGALVLFIFCLNIKVIGTSWRRCSCWNTCLKSGGFFKSKTASTAYRS